MKLVKEPFYLNKLKDNILDTVNVIDYLSNQLDLLRETEGRTFIIKVGVEYEENTHPLVESDLIYIGKCDGYDDRYIYNEIEEGYFDSMSSLLLANENIKWIEEVNSKIDWAKQGSGLSSDIWCVIFNYLSIEKVFVLSGMNKRLREMIHGSAKRSRNDFNFIGHLDRLSFKKISPIFPHSMNPDKGASKMNISSLVRWGHRNIKNYNHLTIGVDLASIPNELGCIIEFDMKNVFISIGTSGRAIILPVNRNTTAEDLTISVKSKLNLKNDVIQFEISPPPLSEMMDMEDSQFQLMGLDLPTRDLTGLIQNHEDLPTFYQRIRLPPKVPIGAFNVRSNSTLSARFFVKRYFKSKDLTLHKNTICDRFNSGKYCKHCYRSLVSTSGCNISPPKSWIEFHPKLKPICIHCFTHICRDDIIRKKKLIPSSCPGCNASISIARDGRFYQAELKKGIYDYYQCFCCKEKGLPAPKLWVAYFKGPIVYSPILDYWRSIILKDTSLIPILIIDHLKYKKMKKIELVKFEIKKAKNIVNVNTLLLKELTKEEEEEEEEEEGVCHLNLIEPQKRPRAVPGKFPMGFTGKRPCMSPVSYRPINSEEEEDDHIFSMFSNIDFDF